MIGRAVLPAALAAALVSPAAAAAPLDALLESCQARTSPDGVKHRICTAPVESFDGTPLDTTLTPPARTPRSGLPLIVPDAGGASDQFVAGQGARYRAADARALAGAIGALLADGPAGHRARAAAAAGGVRTMDRHFAELFARYAALAGRDADVA